VLDRLPRRLLVDLPDAPNRKKILKVVLAKEELGPDVDLDEVAKLSEGYSGSDVKQLCVAAAYQPIRELLEQEKKVKETSVTASSAAEMDLVDPDEPAPTLLRPLKYSDFKRASQQIVRLLLREERKKERFLKLFGARRLRCRRIRVQSLN